MEIEEAPEARYRNDRQLDMESLKALAHPLRVKILDALSIHGDFTASGLAERLGESSGATSYHLRQLERHGFVRDIEGKGTGRERWWQRVPGGIMLNATAMEDTPAMRAATKSLLVQLENSRSGLLQEFQDRGWEELSQEWIAATTVSTANLRLSVSQLKEISDAYEVFIDSHLAKFQGQSGPGLRPVQIHFNAFPIMGEEETPEESA